MRKRDRRSGASAAQGPEEETQERRPCPEPRGAARPRAPAKLEPARSATQLSARSVNARKPVVRFHGDLFQDIIQVSGCTQQGIRLTFKL